MAKTDSFGRPYYETAEEYNQAHRRAKASGSYGQMQQEKKAYHHTVGTGTKKRYGQKNTQKVVASMAIGIAAIICVTMTLMIINVLDSGVRQEETWHEVETEQVFYDGFEQLGADDVPLAEGFDVVTYKAETYTTAMTYQEFIKVEVPLQVYPSPNEELYSGYSENLDLVDEDGQYLGFITIENETDDDLTRGECRIKQILFSNEAAYNEADTVPDVTFANGLDMTCTYEELEANLGVPTYKYTDEDAEGNIYESYHWEYYGASHSEYFCANFWNGVMTDVSVMVDMYE